MLGHCKIISFPSIASFDRSYALLILVFFQLLTFGLKKEVIDVNSNNSSSFQFDAKEYYKYVNDFYEYDFLRFKFYCLNSTNILGKILISLLQAFELVKKVIYFSIVI